jgi:hypothetical protein
MNAVVLLEKELGRTARKEVLPMQPGDVLASSRISMISPATWVFRPPTSLEA